MSRHGRERGAKLITAALIAVILAAALGIVLRKVMVVKNVDVVGAQGEQAQQVLDMSGIRLGQSIFDVDSRQIAINLREDGYVKLESVEVRKPDSVTLNVSRRDKAAALEHLGFVYIVDAELSVLECMGALGDAGVPLITGAQIQQTPVGTPLNMDRSQAELLRDVLAAVKAAGLIGELSEINIAGAQQIYCVTRSGYVFRLGGMDDMAKKLGWILPMQQSLISEGRTGGTVDVTSLIAADYIPPRATPTATLSPAQAQATFTPYDSVTATAQPG